MKFLQRRAILKNANYLMLTPIKLAGAEFDAANNLVVILFPRFTSKFAQRYILPKLKSPHIKLKLDKIASATWLAIDGKKNVGDIAMELSQSIGVEEGGSDNIDVEHRLTKFLTLLYEQKIITFKEIQ
jgi:hypothetical protein